MFEPLLPGVTFARLNDIPSLEAAIGSDTGLVLVEPVQGEGGVNPAEPEFLAAAAALAAEHGALLCVDEVQTGVGRTGTFFAFEQSGVKPDLVTLAKGLANGLPIGACGVWALSERWRKVAMHIALVLALLGFAGTVPGVVKLIKQAGGEELERPEAALAQGIVAVLCLLFLVLGIRSFVVARIAQRKAAAAE